MPPEDPTTSNFPENYAPSTTSVPEPPLPPRDYPDTNHVSDGEFIILEIEEPMNRRPDRRYLSKPIAILGVFLAPVIFVSAMMAEQDNNWKPVFVGWVTSDEQSCGID